MRWPSFFAGPARNSGTLAKRVAVVSHADKFIGTNLQQILEQKGMKAVIVTGVAANGAALYTASHAAFLGYKVIVPARSRASPSPNS